LRPLRRYTIAQCAFRTCVLTVLIAFGQLTGKIKEKEAMRLLPSQREISVRRKLFFRKISTRVLLAVVLVLLLCVMVPLLFGDFLLERFAKPEVEAHFRAAHPDVSLRLGRLHYELRSNKIVASKVEFENLRSATTCQFQNITATGVEWKRLLFGPRRLGLILPHAHLQAQGMDVCFPNPQYEIRCSQIALSVPDSQAVLDDVQLQPSVTDEQFFATREFRRIRFHLNVAHCRFSGLPALELLQGTICRARKVEFDDCALDTVINRDKPINRQAHRLLTLNDLLAAIRIPVQLDQVTFTNSQLRLGERTAPGQPAKSLTFDRVHLAAEHLTYPAPRGMFSPMYGTARFMDAGELSLTAQVPLADPEFSFRYSGSLGAMDLTRLNPFLEAAANCRVKSGLLRELAFSAQSVEGHAQGQLRGLYQDLDLEFLPRNGEGALVEGTKTIVVDELLLRRTNLPQSGKPLAIGRIDYTREPGESFLHFGWFALSSGMMDVLGISRYAKH
jgi:hypothetical protein